MAVNKIISFIHECVDERTSEGSFVDTLHMILPAMELLTMLTRIGSGALQAVKGNIFYPILQAFRSQDDGVGERTIFHVASSGGGEATLDDHEQTLRLPRQSPQPELRDGPAAARVCVV